jgi:hypothetical protein
MGAATLPDLLARSLGTRPLPLTPAALAGPRPGDNCGDTIIRRRGTMTPKRTGHAPAIVAHHEAGHAVIAHMLGCRVERVSIDEDSGVTLIKWSGKGEQRTERQILSTLAGPYSQRRFAPRSLWRSRSHAGFASGYDFDNVTGLIFRLHGKGKVAEKYWACMEARAEALVDQHWLHIESVVKVLLKHGAITGDIRTEFPSPASVVTGKRS